MAEGGSRQDWTAADVGDQQGRTAVITGATSGLGLETAKVLAEHGATVVLTGRDAGRADAAAATILSAHPGAKVEAAVLDLAELSSVRAAAADIGSRFDRIDLLINNAGVMFPPRGVTKDGFELQFGTNHLGHFALTGLLLSHLTSVPGSRIVTVSSYGHRAGRIDLADLQSASRFNKMAAYGRSKLANLMFTYELQRRLEAAGLPTISLAAHPGTARTELTRHMSPVAHVAMSSRLRLVNSWLIQDQAMGALPILRAATDPDALGGTYYGPSGFMQFTGSPVRVRSSTRSHNADVQHKLWAESEKLTGVSYGI
jgi:NAD(P)-dependent dehydrogenase (short-subunit alcohol dehydrogenase family)